MIRYKYHVLEEGCWVYQPANSYRNKQTGYGIYLRDGQWVPNIGYADILLSDGSFYANYMIDLLDIERCQPSEKEIQAWMIAKMRA